MVFVQQQQFGLGAKRSGMPLAGSESSCGTAVKVSRRDVERHGHLGLDRRASTRIALECSISLRVRRKAHSCGQEGSAPHVQISWRSALEWPVWTPPLFAPAGMSTRRQVLIAAT
jgi:hypothetical protein